MKTSKRYSAEIRERAVRLVRESQQNHSSQWAAIQSIAARTGCTQETLRCWVRQAERDQGERAGLTSDEKALLKQLQCENRELKQANEILRKASAFSPRRSSTADGSDGVVHRRTPGGARGRVDLRAAANRFFDILRDQGATG